MMVVFLFTLGISQTWAAEITYTLTNTACLAAGTYVTGTSSDMINKVPVTITDADGNNALTLNCVIYNNKKTRSIARDGSKGLKFDRPGAIYVTFANNVKSISIKVNQGGKFGPAKSADTYAGISDDSYSNLLSVDGDPLLTLASNTEATYNTTELSAGTYKIVSSQDLSGSSSWGLVTLKVEYATSSSPIDPTINTTNGAYTVGGTPLDLTTCVSSNNTTGAFSFAVKTDGGTSASISGSNFSATTAGTCVVTATQAAVSGTWNEKSVDFNIVVSAPAATHNVTVGVNNALYGSAAAAETTVAEGSTTTITATPNSGYAFKQWTVSGTGATLSSTTTNPTTLTMGTANATVTAEFEEKSCPSSGVVYTMTMKSKSLSGVTQNTEVGLVEGDYATETGGVAYLGNKNATASKAQIKTEAGGIVYFDGNDAYLKLALECPLKPGDLITIEGNASSTTNLYILTSTDSRSPEVTSTNTSGTKKYYTVVADDVLDNKSTIYIWRAGSSANKNIHSVTITRPYSVTFASDHGTAPTTPTKAIELTLEELSDASYTHLGWTADKLVKVGGVDKAAGTALGKTDVVTLTDNTTFTATWEAKVNKYTVTYYDGEAIEANKLGSELINEGSNPTGAGLAPKKRGFTFGGWSLTNGGDAIASYASVTVDADKELFVVWTPVVCPTSGVVFSIVADPSKAPDSDYQIAGNTRADLATYATITRGAAVFGNADGNQRITIKSSTGAISLTGSNMRGYVKATMDCDLQEGDIIRITDNTNKFRVAFDSTATDKVDVSSGNHDVVIDAAHKDKYEFFIYRNGNDVTFSTIQVIRPYTVSFNMNGKTATAIDAQKVADGGKVTKPADPTTTNYTFEGWYKEAACTNAWDFTNDVVNTDVELFANWTAWPTMTLNRGAATSGDDVVTSVEPGSVVTVPACPFSYTDYNFNGWEYSPAVTMVDETHFTMPSENLTLTAQWVDANNVAQIGSTKYATFAEAAAAVADGETIQLLQDCDYDATWTITGMAVTLDLNGKNLTGPASGDAVAITTDGVLTIMDGTATVDPSINGSNEITYAAGKFTGEWLINVYAGGSFVMNSGWLLAGEAAAWVTNSGIVTVNNGVLEALTNAVVMGPGNAGKGGYTMNIHGGILLGHMSASGIANGYSSMAVYHPNTGTLNIDGGTLISENGPGVVVRGGASNITGGTIIAQGNGGGKCGDANAPLIEEVGVAYDFKANYPGVSSVAATISGTANVSGADGAVQAIYAGATPSAAEEAAVAISGGTFNTPVAEALCADDYYPATKPNGKYGVTVAALSVNFVEEAEKTEGQKAWTTFLTDNHYDYNLGDGGEISWDKANAYDTGLKLKKSTNNAIYFTTEPGKLIELTVGNIAGMTIQINGGAAQTITGGTNIDNLGVSSYYSDNAQAVVLKETSGSSGYNMLKSINIRDPYTVSFDVNGGDNPIAPRYATPSVTLPDATNGTQNFAGWYTDADVFVGMNGDSYTPTANITLVAHWEALSTINTLSDLKVDGTTVDGFDADVHTYYIVVPYGTAVADLPKITSATPTNENASVAIWPTEGPQWTDDFGGCYRQQANVTPQDPTAAVGYNDIRITIAPKDMLCIIKAEHDGTATGATVTGYYGGTKDKNTANDGKLGGANQYFGIKLAEEAGTFKAGDVLKIYATNPSAAVRIYSDKGTTRINPTDGTFDAEKMFTYTLTEDDEWIYLYRRYKETETDMNPTLGYMAVYRPVPNPLVETITFNGAAGAVDNTASPKTITVEVPASTDFGTMPVVATFLSNDPSLTNGAVTGGTWAEGDNEYVVTDKDNDQTVYTVTISKAVASNDATLATLTYGTPATAIALADGLFEYNVELPYGTSDVPALAATAHHAGASVTNIADAAAFINRHATSTVTVTAEDGTTTQDYTVNFTVSRYESKLIWDGATMTSFDDAVAAATAAGVSIVNVGDQSVQSKSSSFEDKNYTKCIQYGGATSASRNFGITIPAGKVAKMSIVYRPRSNGERSIIIGTDVAGAINESAIVYATTTHDHLDRLTADIFAGGTIYINTTNGYQVFEISLQLADGFARSSMLGAGVLGTVCVPNNVAIEDIQGVTVYELMGRDYNNYGKLAFDEIISGELEAGAPYVFMANGNHMALLYGETHEDAPVDKGKGMYGTFTDQTLTELDDVYYFAQRALWSCDGLTELNLPANRAYVKLSEVDEVPSPTPNPARRRITMAVNGEKVATGIDNLEASEKPLKLMIDGQMYILRGEKLFDATGRLVK